MKALLLAGACVVMLSGSALACRGTAEFPEALQQLAEAPIAPEQAAVMKDQLEAAHALHKEGHLLSDVEKIAEAIRVLDAIKLKIHE